MLFDNSPECPQCGSRMVLRTALRGRNAGNRFFGCSQYPACKATVSYDPSVHGSIESVIHTTVPSAHPVDIGPDLPIIPQRQPLPLPVSVQCLPKRNGLQCILFESSGFPAELSKLVNRKSIESTTRRALIQWRLDFPLSPEEIKNHQDQTVLAVVEKILLRGNFTILSPTVEDTIARSIIMDEQIDDNDWLKTLKRVSHYGVAPYHHETFESKEEAILYNDLLPRLAPDRNIFSWVIPQSSAASFSKSVLNPECKQRLDFLIAHPNGTQLVVEVDGLQHVSSREADLYRDKLLKDSGFHVLRIQAAEIREGIGPNLTFLQKTLESLPTINTDFRFPPIDQIILLSRAASQIQVALLMAIKTGFLSMDSGSKWNIAVPSPTWNCDVDSWANIAQESIGDLVCLLRAIYKLHHAEVLDISFDISFDPNSPSDLIIVFGQLDKSYSAQVIFEVSNIYIPCHIEHTLPVSPAMSRYKPDRETAEWLLNYIFRKKEFWEGQWEVISRALQGLDSIVLLPTGGGKSIAFQLASLLMPGVCLVVDPLISLIEDQLDNLRANGIDRVIGITSLLSSDEKDKALRSFAHGQYVFCYVAPERLQMEEFRQALLTVTVGSPVSLIAIDEAHCVSEWGHDFRTSYLNVARNSRRYCKRDMLVPPLLGLTGTASRSVLKDIQRELQIMEFDSVITPRSFDRPELNFRVLQCRSSEKQAQLKGYLLALPQEFQLSKNLFFQPRGESTYAGLIFFPHVNGEMGVATGYQILREEVGSVAIYSGEAPRSISTEDWDRLKASYASQFKHNEISVLVCTNAFGMGIDKPNIRYTIHMNLPRSIEAFYQEAGRAGRDRNKSNCCLIVSNDNPERTRDLLNPSKPLSEIARIINKVPWVDADDITRMLYFHVTAFHGIESEEESVRNLIAELGDIQTIRTVNISYSQENRNVREKAVHRLVILGVVEDYTQYYSHNQIRLILSGLGKDAILDHYIDYLRAYDSRMADVADTKARAFMTLDHTSFVISLVRHLLDFIYGTVELGRRRSLAEMLQACTGGSIRKDILNYLALGAYSELLNSVLERQSSLSSTIQFLFEQVTSSNDAAELRGQSARFLESYPNNPALLFIRALAELLCRERDEQIALDNIGSAVAFAISESGWALSYEEVANAVAKLAEGVDPINKGLGVRIVEKFLAEAHDLRLAARAIIEKGSQEIIYPAAEALLYLVSDQLTEILYYGDEYERSKEKVS